MSLNRAVAAGMTFVLIVVAGLRIAIGTAAGQQADASSQLEIAKLNDQYVRQLSEKIAGREGEPAEQVFANVQWLKGVRAGQFLVIMNQGYSRALGVACTHCHDDQNFASDDKRPKRAAREMAAMHRVINTQLAAMEHIATPQSANRAISCIMCHRGSVNPRSAGR